MAYAPRQDGLFDVTLDDGRTLPMALTEEQLQAAGHQPVAPVAPTPDLRTAYFSGGGGGGASSVSDVQAPVPGMPGGGGAPGAVPMSAATPSSMQQPTEAPGGLPPTLGQIQNDPTLTGYEREQAARRAQGKPEGEESKPKRVDKANLVSAPVAAPAAGPVAAPVRHGGGGGGGVKPFRIQDDIRNDLTSDSRAEDTVLNAQYVADLREKEQLDREQLLQQQQRDVELERARRAQIDQKIREKEDVISTREREAESLRPQSAREIWQDRGAFAQAMGAVTMMLGGWLQGYQNRADNPGVSLLNDSIRQEISDQRARYEDAKERGRDARNDYARAIELYGTPEAAEQDMLIRRYAIAENMIKNRGAAVGTAEYLNAANNAAEVFRQQRAQAKMQLNDYERARTLQAASAQAAAAQAQEYARNGIVKIGSQYYTVDPGTKQFVPLDKAAQIAQKGAEAGEGGIPGRGLNLEVRSQTAQTALDAFGRASGMGRDAKGQWFVADPKRYAESLVPGTQAWNDSQAARGQLAGEHAVITNGGNQPSAEEKKEYHDKWFSMRPGAVESNMNNLQENIDATQSTLRNVRIRRAGESGSEPNE